MPGADDSGRVRTRAQSVPAPARGAAMRILVATDGSRGSAAALNFAIRLAVRDAKSELIVLSVEPAPADPRINSQVLIAADILPRRRGSRRRKPPLPE